MSTFLSRLGSAAARHWRRTLVISVLLIAGVGTLGTALGAGFVDDYRTPGVDSTRAQEMLEQRFPQVSGATPRSAVLTWLGERAWRLPRWLDRLLIDLGGSARLKAAPEGQSL